MVSINDQFHFVAINYGGELRNRWVVFMSVLDANVIVKVSGSQLIDLSKWEAGWDERNYIEYSKSINNKNYIKTSQFSLLSTDSGLTIPISGHSIRPWFC